jgi:hypothetical protein
MIPDVIVGDVAYVYTGLRDSRGHKILRRVSRKVGFLGTGEPDREYISSQQDQPEVTSDELYEGE